MGSLDTDDAAVFPPYIVVGRHFGSQNTQLTAARTSTLLGGLTMVHTCVVAGCRNRRTPGTTLSFYRFPRDPERKQRWIAAVNRAGWVPNDGSRLCSTHFISGKDAVQQLRGPFVCLDPSQRNKGHECIFSGLGSVFGPNNAAGIYAHSGCVYFHFC